MDEAEYARDTTAQALSTTRQGASRRPTLVDLGTVTVAGFDMGPLPRRLGTLSSDGAALACWAAPSGIPGRYLLTRRRPYASPAGWWWPGRWKGTGDG